jgi:DNA replicative helicase MCM subunit Mcm2 (Cdc46/Mcm family)
VQRGLTVALYKDTSNFEDKATVVSSWLFERGEKGVGEALACLGLAMHHVMDRYVRNSLPSFKIGDRIDLLSTNQRLDETLVPMEYLQPRLKDHYPITPMRDLKTELFGKVVTVRGTIVRVGPVKTICKRMVYKCDSCGNQFALRSGLRCSFFFF